MKMIIFCRFIVTVVEKKPALCSAGISPDTHRNNVSDSTMLPLDLTLCSVTRRVELDVWPAASNERYVYGYNSSKNISVH